MSASRDLQTRVVAAFLKKHKFPYEGSDTVMYANQWFKLDEDAACELRQFIQLIFGITEQYAHFVARKSYTRPGYYLVNHPELYTLIKESKRDEHN